MKASTIIGLIRDFVAAGLGLAVLFGLGISDDQVAGILLVTTTGLALATFIYGQVKAGGIQLEDDEPSGS